MLPSVGEPVVITLPDGRRAVIKVELVGDDWPTKVPLPVVTPPAPTILPRPVVATVSPPPVVKASYLDHPILGGKLTVFVLCYGPDHEMHQKCLSSLIATVPPGRMVLRVYANAVGPSSLKYLQDLSSQGRIQKLYSSTENRKKYPAMREMFHDVSCPVETPWILWLDDDTMVDRDPAWLEKLAEQIVRAVERDPRTGLVGEYLRHGLDPVRAQWVKAASWYKRRPFRDLKGRESPNGNQIIFVQGSFWAMKAECLKVCDIPDRRLQNNGGDILIGEHVWQHGYSTKYLEWKKTVVNWSSRPRRGLSETIFGL